MNMKKSLIALAVAGAFAAPAFAATSNVDVYGVLNVALEDTNRSAAHDMTILDNTSRIGFKGTEDLGGGLKVVWQIESALGGNGAVMGNNGCGAPTSTSTSVINDPDGVPGNGDETVTTTTATTAPACNNNGFATRNTFVGLAGGFGTVLMGRHDTPYKLGTVSLDIFGDTIADYNLGRLDGVQLVNGTHDHRNGQALAYISPTWSGFHFAVATVLTNNESGAALSKANANIDATSMTGVYANGPLFASLSYQNAKAADNKAWKLGVGYTIGDGKVGFIYERNNDDAAGGDIKSYLLNGQYNMGPIALKAQWGKVKNEGALGDADALMLGVDYNLSKRTSAYFVWGRGDNDLAAATAGRTRSGHRFA